MTALSHQHPRRASAWGGATAISIAALALTSCGYEPGPPGPPRENAALRSEFEAEVYPVLLRDCGFPACHGSEDRFFQVFGPGRVRVGGGGIRAAVRDEELDRSFDRARSMLASARTAEDALLVRKPLAVAAGGAPHLGTDDHRQDVYSSPDEEGYQTLLRWARTGIPDE